MLTARALELALLCSSPSVPEVEVTPRPASYELQWTAPQDCPDDEVVRRRIAALVEPPDDGDGVLYVRASVEATAAGFTLALATEYLGHRSSRTLEASRCADLGEATALMVATSLEPTFVAPEAARRALPDDSPSSPETDEGSAEPPPRADSPEPVLRDSPGRARPELVLRIGARVEYGSLPGVAGGSDLAFGLAWPRARLEIRGTHLWPRFGSGPRDTGGAFQLGAVGVAGCARLWARSVEFPLCAGLEAGALRVASRGLSPAVTVHNPWLAPLASAGLAVGGRRLRFWSTTEVAIAAVRSRIVIADELAFQSVPVSLRLLAGLEIVFAIKGG